MAREVNFDIVAKDKASAQLDAVADQAEKLEKSDPTVEVDADTRSAARDIETFARQLDRLSDTDKVIVLGLRAAGVQRELADLMAEVAQLDSSDPTIEVKAARIGELSAELDDLKAKAREVDAMSVDPDVGTAAIGKIRELNSELDRAGNSQGPRLAGNQIADLTGPFGAASGAASDFGGVFDGIGDIAESVGARVGIETAAMTTAIGGVGLGVAAAAAVWTVFTENQRKAREEQKRITEGQRKLNEAIREGASTEAAQEFIDTYGKFYEAVRKVGLTYGEFVTAVTNGRVPDSFNAQVDESIQKHGYMVGAINDASSAIGQARIAWQEANGTIGEQNTRLDETRTALEALYPELSTTAAQAREMGSRMGEAAREGKALSEESKEAARKQRDLEDAARDVAFALDIQSRKLDDLRGNIEDDQAWLDLEATFDRVRDTAAEAWEKAKKGAEDADEAVRGHKEALNDARLAVIDYATKVLELPAEQVTKIVANVDDAELDDLERRLEKIKDMQLKVRLVYQGGGGFPTDIPGITSAATMTTAASRSGALFQRARR